MRARAANTARAALFGALLGAAGAVPGPLLALLPAAALAAEPDGRAFGVFVGRACPAGDATCLPTREIDRVRVAKLDARSATVFVRIVFDRGQVCLIRGRAQWRDDRFVLTKRAPAGRPDCELGLDYVGDGLRLSDKDLACRTYFCGGRGTFEGATFARPR